MAIPVLPWLAVWLLTFLTYRQRELLQAGLAGAALLLCFAGFVYWLYLNRRSMRRISAERTREIQALLGPGFTLHDDNAGHFLAVLRRTSPTLRRRNIIQMANRFEGPSQDGRGIRLQAHPRFTARFKVKCADEAGARRFLVPLLLEEFERFPDLVVEGCGGHLVLFRPRKILEPAAFPRFQDEVRTLARLFPGEMQIP